MPPTDRPAARGRRVADEALQRLGRELRHARRGAGLSLEVLARAASISHSQVSRLELGQVRSASVRVYSVLFALLGHTLRFHAYPDGAPVRDAAHVRLIRRFVALLPPSGRLRTEVPLRRHGDLRAWDGELRFTDGRCKLEAETVLTDVQALDRRIGLKMADDDVDRVILLVAATKRNRAVLREARELLRPRFPLDTREVLRAIRAGRCPPDSGIVVL
jgi:transcriptional regulator with XRE-family HTH domain